MSLWQHFVTVFIKTFITDLRSLIKNLIYMIPRRKSVFTNRQRFWTYAFPSIALLIIPWNGTLWMPYNILNWQYSGPSAWTRIIIYFWPIYFLYYNTNRRLLFSCSVLEPVNSYLCSTSKHFCVRIVIALFLTFTLLVYSGLMHRILGSWHFNISTWEKFYVW